MLKIATWNLNNRVGRVKFRSEAASAAVALGADIVVFTEYFPQQHHSQFCEVLSKAGWNNQLLSQEPPAKVKANRILIASRVPLEQYPLNLPNSDDQFPANVLAARISSPNLIVLGVRIPAYGSKQKELLINTWDWLVNTAATLRTRCAIILGDFNVPSSLQGGARSLHRLLQIGWLRAVPADGYSFYGSNGRRSEIDHLLATPACKVYRAKYLTSAGGFSLAGAKNSLSDHAVLSAEVET